MERFDGWDTELYHHGIKGQKWGVRRFQNLDGSLTFEGKNRYLKKDGRLSEKGYAYYSKKYTAAGANRIDERLRKGKKLNQAVRPEKIGKAVGRVASAYLIDRIFFGGAGARLLNQSFSKCVNSAAYKIGKKQAENRMRRSMVGLPASKVYKVSAKDYTMK